MHPKHQQAQGCENNGVQLTPTRTEVHAKCGALKFIPFTHNLPRRIKTKKKRKIIQKRTLGPTKKNTAGRKTLLQGLFVYQRVVTSMTEKKRDKTNAAFHQHVNTDRTLVHLRKSKRAHHPQSERCYIERLFVVFLLFSIFVLYFCPLGG